MISGACEGGIEQKRGRPSKLENCLDLRYTGVVLQSWKIVCTVHESVLDIVGNMPKMGDDNGLDHPLATLLGVAGSGLMHDWSADQLYVPSGDDGQKKALFSSLIDMKALSNTFPSLTPGIDYIGARFREGRRESLVDVPPSSSLEDLMGDGWTVQLHQPQRFDEFDNLFRLMTALEARLQTLVGCNLYATPKNSQGLAPHWDDVNVIVLQLQGEKHWDVWECQQRPNVPSGDLDGEALGAPTTRHCMQPGDVLYLPRGFIHRAIAGKEDDTVHVTLSFGQGTDVIDVIMKTLEAATLLPPFQMQLPMSLKASVRMDASIDTVNIPARLRELADHVEKHPELVQNGMNALRHDFMSSRLPPHPAHMPPEEVQCIVPEEEDEIELLADFHCVLRDTPGTVTRIGRDGHKVVVTYEGGDDDGLRIMTSKGNSKESHMMMVGGGCDDDDCEGCDDAGCDGHHAHHDHGKQSSDDRSDDDGGDDDDDDGTDDDDDDDTNDDSDMDDLGPGMIILPPSVLQLFDAENHRLPVTAVTLGLSRTLCELGICKVVAKNKNYRKRKQ